MKYKRGAVVLFVLLISNYVFAQGVSEETNSWDLLLVPILETVFRGELQWRPDWPLDIPCDGFFISSVSASARVIELSGDKESFVLRRNNEGRLTEFPFFLTDRYVNVKVDYDAAGALQRMNLQLRNYAPAEDNDKKTTGQSEEISMNIVFPPDFFPYSTSSPGGAFPVITAADNQYYVYIFESPLFLTETWYDSEGNMLVFSRADTYVTNSAWRIKSLQIQNGADIRFIDYFYDASGNMTEIRFEDRVFSALYVSKSPAYWYLFDLYNELHWDTQGLLTFGRVYKPDGNELITEYRYEYENDSFGNWIKRRETAYVFQYGLLAVSGRGTWSRRIVY